jgi:dTDP-4-dehydrorhamnose reductase
MRILLFGASGMLGFALHRTLHDEGFSVVGAIRGEAAPQSRWNEGLDYLCGVPVEDFEAVRGAIARSVPDVIINAAGVRSLASVDGDHARLIAVNSLFPRQLGELCESQATYLVHFSSDGVFSGAAGGYVESARADATDAYGVSKYLGEMQTATALVLRTSLLGRGLVGNDSLVDWFLARSGVVRGYRRSIFSGLPVNEIAGVVQRILTAEVRPVGLHHLAAAPISKFDLLKLLRAAWSHPVEIEPDDSVSLDRSLDATLLNEKIGYRAPPWPELVAALHAFYEALEKR